MKGRTCLVVGAGKVAARKAEALLDAGARTILVAPGISKDAARLKPKRGLTVIYREFRPSDLDGNLFLVVTATDDAALNRGILEHCHARGLLCTCPDRGWKDGDFISPASFRHGDLTISVSTGGVSCRRSRLIKESLARHAETLDSADLLSIGIDHHTADIASREEVHLSEKRQKDIASMLRQILGVHEFMLLCTCNRVELVAIATSTPALVNLLTHILGFECMRDHVFVMRGFDAFRHMALVTSGLLSQTPWETEIRGQVKDALELSRRNRWSAGIMQDWMGRALRIGNEIRKATVAPPGETGIGPRCESFLKKALGGLRRRRILVIGCGTVGSNVIERLLAAGASVSCCYRTRPPDTFRRSGNKATILPMKHLRKALKGQNAIVCAVAGKQPVLTARHAGWLDPESSLVVVDLGVPRNVGADFAAARADIRIADMDDLKPEDRGHVASVRKGIVHGNRIIREYREEFKRVVEGMQTGN